MNPTLLDNQRHQGLRLNTQLRAEWGDAVTAVPTVAEEFRLLQPHFPIVFQATDQGQSVQPVALLGLTLGHNTWVSPQGGWLAPHLPWALERQPLLVGRDASGWVVHIDPDSPRLGTAQGEALFLPQGGHSPLLQRRLAVLQALHQGMQALPEFVEALLRHQLLEPMSLDIEQEGGRVHRVGGFSVIHEERLEALSGAVVAQLHEAGHWLPIAMAVASMAQLRALVEREQLHRQAQAA
jgi:hypothetical protein